MSAHPIPKRPTAPRSFTLAALKRTWRAFDRQRRAAQNQIPTVRIVRATLVLLVAIVSAWRL